MHRLRRLCARLAPGCLIQVAGVAVGVASSCEDTTECHTGSATEEGAARRPGVYVPCPPGRLAVVRPELIDDWIPELNNADIETVLCSSPLPAWWRCARCGQRYCSAVRERVTRGLRCCPHCHGHGIVATAAPTVPSAAHDAAQHDTTEADVRAAGDTRVGHDGRGVRASLATTHPALAARWHTTRNGTLSPAQVTAESTRCAWWCGAEEGRASCARSFRRPVCAFVADSRSPAALQRAQDELEWGLLQRICVAMHPADYKGTPQGLPGVYGLLPPDKLAAMMTAQPRSESDAVTPRAGGVQDAMLAVWKRRVRAELAVPLPATATRKRTGTLPQVADTVTFAHAPGFTTDDARRLRTALLTAYTDVVQQKMPHTDVSSVLLHGDDASWLDYFASTACAESKQVEQAAADGTSCHAAAQLAAPPASCPAAQSQAGFPAPPTADELATAAAEASEQQARMRLEETRRVLQGRRTAQRTASLFERFMTGMSPEEEAEVLACYPRWRPYAAYAHGEDDVTEATPIETTFHATAARRGSAHAGQAPRPPRQQRPVFSFPSAADTLRALNLDYDDDEDDRSAIRGGGGRRGSSSGGGSVGHSSGNGRQAGTAGGGDDGDLDLATRLRVSASQDGAQRSETAESRASLVGLAVRALGDSVVARADAQAVQLEQDVMQSLRPLPEAGTSQDAAAASATSLVSGAGLPRRRRVRMQMPAEAKGAATGVLTAPRTPRKVARPRRATSERSN